VFAENRAPVPKQMRPTGGQAMNRIYETRDGKYIVLGASEVKFAENLLRALGRPDLVEYAREEPGPKQKPLVDYFVEVFATKTRGEWEKFLSALDLGWAPVRTLKDAFDDPNTRSRAMLMTDDAGNRHIGPAIKFRDDPARPSLALPSYAPQSATRPSWRGN